MVQWVKNPTALAQVTEEEWVRSLAWELPMPQVWWPLKKKKRGVPFVAQQLTNPTRINEDSGLIHGLAQWVKDLVLS